MNYTYQTVKRSHAHFSIVSWYSVIFFFYFSSFSEEFSLAALSIYCVCGLTHLFYLHSIWFYDVRPKLFVIRWIKWCGLCLLFIEMDMPSCRANVFFFLSFNNDVFIIGYFLMFHTFFFWLFFWRWNQYHPHLDWCDANGYFANCV